VLANYSLLLRALVANFVLVPLYAVIVLGILHVDDTIAAGIILMAIAPGVPFVVMSAGRKKGGSLGFAAALSLIMPALSVLTVPLTAELLLPHSENAPPLWHFFESLVSLQLAPLIVGMILADRAPTIAPKLEPPLLVVASLSILALFVLLGDTIVRAVALIYGSYGILAALLIVLLSLVTGWLLGGPEGEYRRTLSIATVLRNIGLAITLATTMFPDSLVGAAVMAYFVVQVIVGVAIGAYYSKTVKPTMAVAHDT
jgi:BASS family bile acid:Na+ symporter